MWGYVTEGVDIKESCHTWGYVTEGVDMKESCHTWSSVFSPTLFISQCVCVCAYMHVRVCVREGVDMKELCHTWSSVLFGVMSHRESCLIGSLDQRVMSRIEFCLIWSHVT